MKYEELFNIIAENIREERTAQGMSMQKLADKSGISKRTINFIENKRIDNVSIKLLHKLAEAFGVEVIELINKW